MSNSDLISTLVASVGGGLVTAGALAAWLGSVWKDRIARAEMAAGLVDVDLRTKRIAVYKTLWAHTKILPRWPRDQGVTYEHLLVFTHTLRDWYFTGGGMYLSRTTHRDGYTPLQDELERVLEQSKAGLLSQSEPDDYEAIRGKCSNLRSLLAADIESRRESPLHR